MKKSEKVVDNQEIDSDDEVKEQSVRVLKSGDTFGGIKILS